MQQQTPKRKTGFWHGIGTLWYWLVIFTVIAIVLAVIGFTAIIIVSITDSSESAQTNHARTSNTEPADTANRSRSFAEKVTVVPFALSLPKSPETADEYYEAVSIAILTAASARGDLFSWNIRQDRDEKWDSAETQQRVVENLLKYEAILHSLGTVTPPLRYREFHSRLLDWATASHAVSVRLLRQYYQYSMIDSGLEELLLLEDQIFDDTDATFPTE